VSTLGIFAVTAPPKFTAFPLPAQGKGHTTPLLPWRARGRFMFFLLPGHGRNAAGRELPTGRLPSNQGPRKQQCQKYADFKKTQFYGRNFSATERFMIIARMHRPHTGTKKRPKARKGESKNLIYPQVAVSCGKRKRLKSPSRMVFFEWRTVLRHYGGSGNAEG